MKPILFLFTLFLPMLLSAQTPAPADNTAPVIVTEPAKKPVVKAVPVATPAPIAQVVAQSPAPEAQNVVVPEPAAPPEWAQKLIMTAQTLPVVGPYISKALVYLGILGAILTSLVGFLLALIETLSGVLNIAGLANFATKLQLFKNGKVMYWLKYFSMFNAKTPEAKPATPA